MNGPLVVFLHMRGDGRRWCFVTCIELSVYAAGLPSVPSRSYGGSIYLPEIHREGEQAMGSPMKPLYP